MAIRLKNIRGRNSAPPMHFNVTDLHCLERKNSKKQNFNSTTILSSLGSKMIKISGLGTDLGYYWLNLDLLGLKFDKISKHMLFCHF